MKIRWSDYFDRIYCLHYLGNDRRLPMITREFDRVGIDKSGIFSFAHTSKDPWERYVEANCPRTTEDAEGNRGFVNLGLATARILRESLALGYRRVLILEDDIRFLKDTSEIRETLDDLPAYPIVQLDKFLPWEISSDEYRSIVRSHVVPNHPLFYDGGIMFLASGACFCADARGMRALLDSLERNGPRPVDGLFHQCGVRRACAIRNMAVQVAYGDALLFSYLKNGNTHHRAYRNQGVRYEDYNVPEGYGYESEFAPYED